MKKKNQKAEPEKNEIFWIPVDSTAARVTNYGRQRRTVKEDDFITKVRKLQQRARLAKSPEQKRELLAAADRCLAAARQAGKRLIGGKAVSKARRDLARAAWERNNR
jgi:hypothetical protein